jgi:cytochrome P450
MMPAIWIKANDKVRRIEEDLRHNPDAVFDIFDYTRHLMWDISELITLGPDSQIDSQVRERLSTFLLEPSGSMLVVWFRLLLCNVGFWPLVSLISPLFTMTYVGGWLNYVRKFVRRCVTDRERRFREHKAAEGGNLNITSFSMATGAFSTGELVDNDMLYTLAATKSIAVAFEWAMYELGQHKDVRERLRAEINANATPGHDEGLGAKLQSLPYLTAVCNEVFRLHPFVPLTPMLAEKNTTLLGESIPKDTVILVPVEHFNRNAEIWGQDGNEFNPERWLDEDWKVDNYAMLTFGAGPKGCIGQHYARGALMCLVAAFVRRLELTLVNVDTAGRLEAAIYKKSEEGVKVRFRMMET